MRELLRSVAAALSEAPDWTMPLWQRLGALLGAAFFGLIAGAGLAGPPSRLAALLQSGSAADWVAAVATTFGAISAFVLAYIAQRELRRRNRGAALVAEAFVQVPAIADMEMAARLSFQAARAMRGRRFNDAERDAWRSALGRMRLAKVMAAAPIADLEPALARPLVDAAAALEILQIMLKDDGYPDGHDGDVAAAYYVDAFAVRLLPAANLLWQRSHKEPTRWSGWAPQGFPLPVTLKS